MKELLNISVYRMKESFLMSRFKVLKICCIILIALIMSGLSLCTVKAQASLKIYDVSKKATSDYKGKQIKATLNGTMIGDSDTPGILVDGIALLPYDDIFQNSDIYADCNYNEKKGTITISKYKKTIIMTIGSKTAKVNNKNVIMSAAPLKIKYVPKDKTKILVPSRFVSEALGLSYTWYADQNMVAIKKHTILLSYNGGEKFEYNGTQAKVSIDGKNISLGSMPNIIINSTAMLRAKAVFADSSIKAGYTYNKADKSITISKNENKIVMTVGSKSAVLNGKSITLTTAPVSVTNHETNVSYIMVPGSVTATSLGYSYQWNSASKTSVITTKSNSSDEDNPKNNNDKGVIIQNWKADLSQYDTTTYNILTEASISTDNEGDYLTLKAVNPLDASVTEQSGLIFIDLPGTINGIQDLNKSISGTKFIKQIASINTANHTQLILTLNQGYQYNTNESSNKFSISFKKEKEIEESKYNIIIPKPSDVTSSMISDDDYYHSHYFVITLKGDYKSYFDSNAFKNNSSVVSNISVSLTSGNDTKIKITTTKLQGYKITSDNNNIYVKVGNPKDIYKNIVILDPGHGGDAPGTMSNGIKEKDLNFKILYTIGKKYFNQDPSKLKVYYTRTSDVNPTLLERAGFAKSVGADLFVSLHMNSVEKAPNACGTEVFYSKDNNKMNCAGLTSQKLAGLILTKLYPAIGTSNRTVKEAAFTVIKKNTVPAVLIELGFMTNTTDYSIITNETKQNIAAETIYNTLLKIFETYPTGR